MATSIPPHNVEEICNASLHLIKHRNSHFDKLIDFIPGPDFPTGGEIYESRESILNIYKTGKGNIRIRAKWEIEKEKRGVWKIVVTEIPYQVNKGKLIEKIAQLIIDKKLPILDDVRDESDENIRLILVPRNRDVNPKQLMEASINCLGLTSLFLGTKINLIFSSDSSRTSSNMGSFLSIISCAIFSINFPLLT